MRASDRARILSAMIEPIRISSMCRCASAMLMVVLVSSSATSTSLAKLFTTDSLNASSDVVNWLGAESCRVIRLSAV